MANTGRIHSAPPGAAVRKGKVKADCGRWVDVKSLMRSLPREQRTPVVLAARMCQQCQKAR